MITRLPGKRFQRMVEPCASRCQCSRHGVRSPDSCTQNLYIQHVKKSAASRHSQRLLHTRRRLPPCVLAPGTDPSLLPVGSNPGERVSTDPSDWQWKLQYQIARHCVQVGLVSRFSETAKILLRISVVTVVAFHSKPTVKAVTVSRSEFTGFRASLLGSLAAGVLREEAVPCKLSSERPS
jgi:hypothetical protein